MNYSKYRFNLDMQSYISQISLPVRQHDTGIVLRINLTDGGVPYVIRDGCRAVFYARKSDGNPLMNDCIIEKNTTICYELTQQTTSCSGVVDCEVRLYGSDGNLITTPRFILVIDSRVVHDEDFPLSESEQTVLDNIILSEQKRLQNEEERTKTYEEMLDTVREASEVADTLTEKLATGDYNGITPHIGENRNWWIGEEDTGILARGITPHIGTNGNWWFGEEDTGILASGYTIPLRAGESSYSIEQQAPSLRKNKVLSQSSVGFGENCVSGCMGYYISEIYYGDSSNNPQIRVATSMPVLSGLKISSSKLTASSSFTAPKYSTGAKFNITCGSHYFYIGTISSINKDVITFTGDVEVLKSGFQSSANSNNGILTSTSFHVLIPGTDDYTMCVPAQPTVGAVSVSALSFTEGSDNQATGIMSHAEGRENVSGGAYSHTEGRGNLAGYAAHAEGYLTQATEMYAHAEGWGTKATAMASHAEGRDCQATAHRSHAEGWKTKATSADAHAEGRETIASGGRSHAEGYLTEASGHNSHASGSGTKATASNQTAIGQYNKVNSNALFIVGNGTSDTARSNAFEVLKDGTAIIGGNQALMAMRGKGTLIKYKEVSTPVTGGGSYSTSYYKASLVLKSTPKWITFNIGINNSGYQYFTYPSDGGEIAISKAGDNKLYSIVLTDNGIEIEYEVTYSSGSENIDFSYFVLM